MMRGNALASGKVISLSPRLLHTILRSPFFLMKKTGAPYGEVDGRKRPFSKRILSCLLISLTSEFDRRITGLAGGVEPGIVFISNSITRVGGNFCESSSRKISLNSLSNGLKHSGQSTNCRLPAFSSVIHAANNSLLPFFSTFFSFLKDIILKQGFDCFFESCLENIVTLIPSCRVFEKSGGPPINGRILCL